MYIYLIKNLLLQFAAMFRGGGYYMDSNIYKYIYNKYYLKNLAGDYMS